MKDISINFLLCGTKDFINLTKTCIKCKQEFPKTLEYFNRQGKYLRSYCKVCSNTMLREWGIANPEKGRARSRAWQKANPEKIRAAMRKYNALKAGNIHEDWREQELLSTYGTDCYLCNKPIDFDVPRKGLGSDYSFWPDHVIPTSKGGENTIRNVRPCHKSCNKSKHNKTYEEYMLTTEVNSNA